MGRQRILFRATLALLVFYITLSGVVGAAELSNLTIGSGNIGGVYYAASAALAKVVNSRSAESGLRLVNQASQGSMQNINDVLEGKAALGIAQADMLFKAVQGLGPWQGNPQPGLRGILALHTEVLTLVAAGDAGINTLADLKGKRLNIGAPGSADSENARLLLELSGISPLQVKLSEEPAALASDLLQEGKIDAYFYTVGHPNLSVREVSEGRRKVRLVPLSPPLVESLSAARPFLFAASISLDHYPALLNSTPVPSIGEKAVLFSRADLDEASVALLVQTVLKDLDLLRRQHLALSDLTIQEMARVPVVPLHPGAESALREAGMRR